MHVSLRQLDTAEMDAAPGQAGQVRVPYDDASTHFRRGPIMIDVTRITRIARIARIARGTVRFAAIIHPML